jgi:AcrR family transcriptional regulator
MPVKRDPPTRGRPKTLERDHVLQTALMCYWADGPTNVSISDICLKTGASKPSVYREFGSDDGLKEAALETYERMVFTPLYDIIASDQPFEKVLEALISFTIQDRRALGLPDGCLYSAMRAHSDELGEITREKVDQLRLETLANYERWIERAKSKGEFRKDIPTDTAALYFDTQNGGAMRLQKEGVPNAVIGEVLKLAFSVLR